MIKKITIEYCEDNQKYDVFIDDEFRGKHYHLAEAIYSILRYGISELVIKADSTKQLVIKMIKLETLNEIIGDITLIKGITKECIIHNSVSNEKKRIKKAIKKALTEWIEVFNEQIVTYEKENNVVKRFECLSIKNWIEHFKGD